jgi:hypothetical protein
VEENCFVYSKEKSKEKESAKVNDTHECSNEGDFDFNIKCSANLFNKYKARVNRETRRTNLRE